MASASTHLHFSGTTEDAFNFYKAAFGTEFVAPIVRMGDLLVQPGQPELSAADKHLVLSLQLPITGDHPELPENTMAAALPGPAYAIDDATAIQVVDGVGEIITEGHWKHFAR